MLNENKQYPLFNVDWVILTLYIVLLICGWFSICGASHELGDTDFLHGQVARVNKSFGLVVP